jgi:uncharacterized protein
MATETPAATPPPGTSSGSAQTAHGEGVSWAGVGLFVLLAFGISWVIWLGLLALGVPFTIRTAIGMFGPALAALLVRGPLRREGFGDAGLRLSTRGSTGAWRHYLAAYLTMPLLLAAGLALALLIGYQHWVSPVQTLETLLRQQLTSAHTSVPRGYTLSQLAAISLVAELFLAFTLAIPINMIFTFGEEFGWRGYLLPRLAPLGGTRAAIVVGVIWGLWHAPIIVLDGYNYPRYPWAGVAMMVIFTTAYSLIFAWLRFRSGSVWPSTLAHAALNAQAGFLLLALSQGNPLLRPPLGVIGIVPALALGIWLAATGKLRPTTMVQ